MGFWYCWQHSCLWKIQPWRQFMELTHNPVTPGRKKTPEHVVCFITALYNRLFQIALYFSGFLLGQVLPGAHGRAGMMSGKCWYSSVSCRWLITASGHVWDRNNVQNGQQIFLSKTDYSMSSAPEVWTC